MKISRTQIQKKGQRVLEGNKAASAAWSIHCTATEAYGSGVGLAASIMHPVDVTTVYLQTLSPKKLIQGHVIIMTIKGICLKLKIAFQQML